MSAPVSGDRLEYEKRVNRVVDHIREHLADELTLAGLARVAFFSPFHFHRVFKTIMGETLFGFIHRLRVEKAAVALRDRRDRSVLEIALDHGFSSPATFARAFRAHFGMSATEWRAGGAERWSASRRSERNPGKQLRKHGKASRRSLGDAPRRKEEPMMNPTVTELPARRVAYLRRVGPYGAHGIPELWNELETWVQAHDLGGEDTIKLGIAHDDPSVTAPEKCRYDAGVVVPSNFRESGSVNVMDVPAGRYAVTEFVGTAAEIQDAWDRVFATWLPRSGYQPDDRPCLEVYRGNPMVAGRPGTFRCDLCLPVRPL